MFSRSQFVSIVNKSIMRKGFIYKGRLEGKSRFMFSRNKPEGDEYNNRLRELGLIEEGREIGVGAKIWQFLVRSWRDTFPNQEYNVLLLQQKRIKSIIETREKNLIQNKSQLKDKVYRNNKVFFQNQTLMPKRLSLQKSQFPKAIAEMRKVYQNFELSQLQVQAKYLFLKTYSAFLSGDDKTVRTNCKLQALNYFQKHKVSLCKSIMKPYCTQLKYPKVFSIINCKTLPQQYPLFQFTIDAQYTDCLVHNITQQILYGSPTNIHHLYFKFIVQYSPQAQQKTNQPWVLYEIIHDRYLPFSF